MYLMKQTLGLEHGLHENLIKDLTHYITRQKGS